MSVDSNNKRRAAGNLPSIWVIYPVPDGTIDDLDRMQAAGFYPLGAGEAQAPVVVEEEAVVVTLVGGALARGVRRRALIGMTREYRDAEDELLLVLLA